MNIKLAIHECQDTLFVYLDLMVLFSGNLIVAISNYLELKNNLMKPIFLKVFLLFSFFSMHVLHSLNLTDKELSKLKELLMSTKEVHKGFGSEQIE